MQFVDTNILLYSISRDPTEQDKAKVANGILASRDLALSVQVLQEFYVQATRASRPDPITHQQAVRLIESFRRFPVQDITSAIVMSALATRQRFQLSYWDSAIIEAARVTGCAEVLSEDLGDGQDYNGVRVANPFRAPLRGRAVRRDSIVLAADAPGLRSCTWRALRRPPGPTVPFIAGDA